MGKCAESAFVSLAWRRLKVDTSEDSWMSFCQKWFRQSNGLEAEIRSEKPDSTSLAGDQKKMNVTVYSGLEMHPLHQEQFTAVLFWTQMCITVDLVILAQKKGSPSYWWRLETRNGGLTWEAAPNIWSVWKGLVPRNLGGILGEDWVPHCQSIASCPNLLVRWRWSGFPQQTAEVTPATLGGGYFSTIPTTCSQPYACFS